LQQEKVLFGGSKVESMTPFNNDSRFQTAAKRERTNFEVNKSNGNYGAACAWLPLMLDELLLY